MPIGALHGILPAAVICCQLLVVSALLFFSFKYPCTQAALLNELRVKIRLEKIMMLMIMIIMIVMIMIIIIIIIFILLYIIMMLLLL